MKIINKITALIIRGYKKSFDPTGRDNRLQYVSIVLFQTMLFLCYDYFFLSVARTKVIVTKVIVAKLPFQFYYFIASVVLKQYPQTS